MSSEEEANKLYEIAENHNTYLFVDWLFTYNYGVGLIKQYIEDKNGHTKGFTMQVTTLKGATYVNPYYVIKFH